MPWTWVYFGVYFVVKFWVQKSSTELGIGIDSIASYLSQKLERNLEWVSSKFNSYFPYNPDLGLVWLIRFVESWLMTQMEILWLTQFFWFNSIFESTHFISHGSNMNHDSYLSPESNMSHDSNMNHNSNMSHNSNMNHNSKVRHNRKIEF